MNFIKNQYREAWIFFKEAMAKRLAVTLLVFVALCAVTGVIFAHYSVQAQEIIFDFMDDIAESGVLDENGDIGMLPLLWNNLRASLMAAAAGVVPFLFLPVLALVMNAVIIGALLGLYGSMGGAMMVCKTVVLGLLPHGIFEIPAIMLGVSMGLYLCSCLNKAIRKTPGAPRLEEVLPQLVRQAVCIMLPLLILAAAIETYVTPLLMGFMY